MGISSRAFLIDEKDRVHRLPYARFQRLWDGTEGERLEEHTGRRMRIAIAYVTCEGRKPLEVIRWDLIHLPLDREGRVDPKTRERFLREAMEVSSFFLGLDKPPAVAKAEARLAQMRHRRRCSWELTPELSAALHIEIFGGPRIRRP